MAEELSYFQLFAQAMQEMNDPEMFTVEDDFPRQLCEIALCLLLLKTQAQTQTATLGFPADTLPGVVDYIPVIDLYEQTPQPDILQLVAVRDSTGKELTKGSVAVIGYFDDSWTATVAVPTEYYMLATNLIGVRKAPVDNVDLTVVFVPYIEVVDMQDVFPLGRNYEDRFIALLRMFLLLRLSNFETATHELQRFLT